MGVTEHDRRMGKAWHLDDWPAVRAWCDERRRDRWISPEEHYQIEAWRYEGRSWPWIAKKLGKRSRTVQNTHAEWLRHGKRENGSASK